MVSFLRGPLLEGINLCPVQAEQFICGGLDDVDVVVRYAEGRRDDVGGLAEVSRFVAILHVAARRDRQALAVESDRAGLDVVNNSDLSSLKVIGSVGEPINEEAWIWYHEHIGKKKCPVV